MVSSLKTFLFNFVLWAVLLSPNFALGDDQFAEKEFEWLKKFMSSVMIKLKDPIRAPNPTHDPSIHRSTRRKKIETQWKVLEQRLTENFREIKSREWFMGKGELQEDVRDWWHKFTHNMKGLIKTMPSEEDRFVLINWVHKFHIISSFEDLPRKTYDEWVDMKRHIPSWEELKAAGSSMKALDIFLREKPLYIVMQTFGLTLGSLGRIIKAYDEILNAGNSFTLLYCIAQKGLTMKNERDIRILTDSLPVGVLQVINLPLSFQNRENQRVAIPSLEMDQTEALILWYTMRKGAVLEFGSEQIWVIQDRLGWVGDIEQILQRIQHLIPKDHCVVVGCARLESLFNVSSSSAMHPVSQFNHRRNDETGELNGVQEQEQLQEHRQERQRWVEESNQERNLMEGEQEDTDKWKGDKQVKQVAQQKMRKEPKLKENFNSNPAFRCFNSVMRLSVPLLDLMEVHWASAPIKSSASLPLSLAFHERLEYVDLLDTGLGSEYFPDVTGWSRAAHLLYTSPNEYEKAIGTQPWLVEQYREEHHSYGKSQLRLPLRKIGIFFNHILDNPD